MFEELGKLDDAERAFRKAVELNSQSATSWDRLGDILARLKRRKEAEQAFRRAIEIDPRFPCAWHNLGYFLSRDKRYEEAEKACKTALELDSKHVNAWVDLGSVFRGRGRLAEAESSYRKAIELDSKSDLAWANLATTLRRLERYDEAKKAYQTAIDLNPNKLDVWSDLGHLTSKVGPPEEAERIWREGIRRHPSLVRCAVHLLEARLAQGIGETVILREAEEWIELAGRSAGSLDSMARFILRANLTDGLPQSESWAREGTASDNPGRVIETLPLVLAAQNRWKEAVQASQPVMDAAAKNKTAQQSITEFLIQAAAAGHAREGLELLQSQGSGHS